METLSLGPETEGVRDRGERGGVNWSTVAAVIAAAIALLLWFGVSPRSYADQLSAMSSRVTRLEANRDDDVTRMERIEDTEKQIDSKVDQILGKLPPK